MSNTILSLVFPTLISLSPSNLACHRLKLDWILNLKASQMLSFRFCLRGRNGRKSEDELDCTSSSCQFVPFCLFLGLLLCRSSWFSIPVLWWVVLRWRLPTGIVRDAFNLDQLIQNKFMIQILTSPNYFSCVGGI